MQLNLPRGVKIVGFADDVALLVIGEITTGVEMLTTEAIDAWLATASVPLKLWQTSWFVQNLPP